MAPHAIAFARMMFAHTSFERAVAALQDAITKEPGFGERRANQYGTRERPARMVELIKAHRGKDFPQTGAIERLLTDAIDPCEQRHLLAHGTWWAFNRRTAAIIVRSGTRWEHPKSRQSSLNTQRPTSKRWRTNSRTLTPNSTNCAAQSTGNEVPVVTVHRPTASAAAMSALPPKADMCSATRMSAKCQ